MKRLLNILLIILVLPFSCLNIPIKAEESTETIKKIKAKEDCILSAARRFNVQGKYLKAIIYTERNSNFDWKDETFDELLAKSGLNSSIGFCQLKLKTAYWIEHQLNDEKSELNPGNKFGGILKVSKSPGELIKKLENDSLNILYAAAYIKIIQQRWKKFNFSIDNSPEIIGTLYSTGLYYPNGKERIPNASPKANLFGKNVKKALISFFLILIINISIKFILNYNFYYLLFLICG